MDLSEGKGIAVPAAPDIQQLPHIDKRKFIVIPYRAAVDRKITPGNMRALQIVCSYANKAGILWASQERMAKDIGLTKTGFNFHVRKLKKLGYLKTEHRGWRGERADTLRIVYEPGQTLDDILAINNDPALAPPERQDRLTYYTEEDLMPRPKKKDVQQQSTKNDIDRTALQQDESGRLTLEEGTRVFGEVVNEAELGLITLALELGATRGMLEVCACAGDRVGALKVLIGRLDRACR